jgi:LysR family cys regulon transcriptional activator
MTLQQLAYIHEIVRHGFNISKTAEALAMTQPGLSRQVLELERELGVDIFVRRRNRLTQLSAVGNVIHDLASSILLQAEGIRRAGRELQESGRGSLTIATTHTQARYALPNVVQAFARRFPNVSLRLRQGTPSETARMVADGTADLSIATVPDDSPSGIAYLASYELPRIVLMPKRHPLARQHKITLEQLVRYPLITYDYAFASRSKAMEAFARRGLSPTIVLNAIDADVIKAYVELGMGIAIVPSLAFDAKRDKHLRALPAGHLFEPNVIKVGIRSRDYLPGYAYEFIEMFAPHLDRPTVTRMIRTNVQP